MKLGTYLNFSSEEDIQIQTAISRLLVHMVIPNNVDPNLVAFRIRAFGSRGYEPLLERTSGLDLFEIAAAREGFYRLQNIASGAFHEGIEYPNGAVIIIGQIEIGVGGSLVMPAGAYLSLDVTAPYLVPKMRLWALAGPLTTKMYHRYTPVTIQETLKDIPLSGVKSIVFNPFKLSAIKFQYPSQGVDYDREELEAIGININDLVSVNVTTGTIVAGYNRLIEMDTDAATRCTIEPADGAGTFNVLNITHETLT